MNKITHISYAAQAGQKDTFTQSATLIQGQGMAEDYHSQLGDDGLVVIASKPLLDWMQEVGIEGLCFKRFRYNICLFESNSQYKSGDIIRLGEAKLEFSTRHKPCYASKQHCDIPKNSCKLPHEMKFAEIQKSGIISVGDVATLRI